MGKRPAAERAALGRVQRLLGVRVAEDVPARRKVGLPLQRLPARIAVGHRAEAEAPENGENDWAWPSSLGAIFCWSALARFVLAPGVTYQPQVVRCLSAPVTTSSRRAALSSILRAITAPQRIRTMSQPGKRLRVDGDVEGGLQLLPEDLERLLADPMAALTESLEAAMDGARIAAAGCHT